MSFPQPSSLYVAERHQPLAGAQWSEARARDAIERIAADTQRAFRGADLWRIHPLDASPERPAAMKPLYFGAAGVIWALERLAETGAVRAGPDYRPIARELVRLHREDLRANAVLAQYLGGERGSFLLGELGLLVLEFRADPREELAREIERALGEKLGDARGLAWGAAGSMLAALFMHERTGEARWRECYLEHVEALWKRWELASDLGAWLWTDELYGVREARLGALHGFAANAHAILRGRQLLPRARRDEALARIARTLQATARREGDAANWPHDFGPSNRPEPMPMLVQFCAGAPGVVACLDALAAHDAETAALLRAGGELAWRAGPAAKLPVLCHGAPAAGYAFLKLHARTREPLWLERARAFAMHALDQAERALAQHGQRKFSLFTGDLGLALFLWDCVRERAELPLLDVF